MQGYKHEKRINQVLRNRLIVLTMTATTTFIAACSSGSSDVAEPPVLVTEITRSEVPGSQQRVISTADSFAFVANGPYAELLNSCRDADTDSLCTTAQLPLLGQNGNNITINDIMSRVVTTHDWMGPRFQQLLERLGPEALKLFGPIAVITLGGDSEDYSFTNLWRGSLYIPTNILWLTEQEKAALYVPENTGDDDTAEVTPLPWLARYRWMKGDDWPYYGNDLDEREYTNLEVQFASNLYYPLAYINGLIPPTTVAQALPTETPRDLFDNTLNDLPTQLYADESLTIDPSPVYALEETYHDDIEPTVEQLAQTPAEVGGLFGNEGKMRLWAYSSREADFATLLQAGMLDYTSDVYVDVAFNNPGPDFTVRGCDDETIGWGVRNRIASPLVTPRVRFAMESVLGTSPELDNFFAGIGEETVIPAGLGWCEAADSVAPR